MAPPCVHYINLPSVDCVAPCLGGRCLGLGLVTRPIPSFVFLQSSHFMAGMYFDTLCEWYRLVSDPKSPKKSIPQNPLFWRSRSFKVIEFGANRVPVYDFLLVINSNLGPISHRYWDTVTYWLKSTNFAHPLSFSTLVQGDPLRIYRKALRFLKQVFQAADGEDLVILACTAFDWSTRVTDRQTDGQNCDG